MEQHTVLDSFKRPLRDLRISVTDRCNFRCTYCMPKEVFGRDYVFLPREQLLTFEEITRLSRIFVAHGVQKVRLTGGEPLLRRDLYKLVAMLSEIEGLDDLALTTNGSLLAAQAQALKDAGLQRVTVSLDSLNDATFMAMNEVAFPVAKVLEAIDVAADVGLTPVKVDMVVKRGVNDGDILDMATHLAGRCATCGSRSRTAAISAAPTACRRRSSGATTRSFRATRCSRSRRSTAPRAPSSSSASKSCGSPEASRSSGATCRTSSRCSPRSGDPMEARST